MAFEPNHTCKNPKCGISYYACDDCDKSKGVHWRSLCCTPKCFQEYMEFIEERDNPKPEKVVDVVQDEKPVINKQTNKK